MGAMTRAKESSDAGRSGVCTHAPSLLHLWPHAAGLLMACTKPKFPCNEKERLSQRSVRGKGNQATKAKPPRAQAPERGRMAQAPSTR